MFGKLISKFTVTPLLYACGALLVIAIGLGIALKVQAVSHKGSLDSANAAKTVAVEALATMTADRDRLQTVANGNTLVVDDLTARLQLAVGVATASAEAAQRAVDARNAAWAARDAALSTLKAERARTYAQDPECRAWNARPVCPAVTDGVLDQWERARDSR